jgi:two-component system, NtrC family, response regulator AtoC
MTDHILLVDDDPFTQQFVIGLLRGGPARLVVAGSVAEARAAYHAQDFNLVILDQRLPDGNGLALFAEMKAERPRQMAILITGYADYRDAVRAVKEGLFDYFTKPFDDIDAFEAVIGKALEMDHAYREIDRLRERLEARPGQRPIVYRSLAMEQLLDTIRKIAPLDTTVLIEGESGTGKELVARQIHAQSSRSGGPLLEVNCGALSESLLEATLFGYEKGAFTSATRTTPGYFESAKGGTLFLDEIADMSAKLQASLLRVLQEQTFTRLGSTAQQSSDFRLVCATNRKLDEETRQGRFRSDLFYRINVVSLAVPPLRERREDIQALALFYLDHFCAKFRKTPMTFTPDAMLALESAPWPGNVRELQHAIERAVAVAAGTSIARHDLGPAVLAPATGPSGTNELIPYREARERFEREYFATVMRAARGNVSEGARLAGIARQNFHSRVVKFRLS